MSNELILMVLAAALLHAVWNAMAKSGGNPLLSVASYQAVGSAVCLFALPFVAVPEPASWPYLLASVLILNVYYFTLLTYGLVVHAMSMAALALVSSLRETSVIFATLIGAVFLCEPFGRQRVAAALLVAGVITIKSMS